jgi:hypothetical protein
MYRVFLYRIYTHPNDMPDDSLYSRVYMVVLEDLELEVLRLVDHGYTIIKIELAETQFRRILNINL